MKKLLVLTLILCVGIFLYGDAAGTAAGTRLTNRAYAGAGNLAQNVTNGIGTTVLSIEGGTWTSADADQGSAAAGTLYTYSTWLTNEGNTNDWFSLAVTNNATNTPTGGAWTTSFSNVTSGALATVTRCTMNADSVANIVFKCTVNAAAGNASYREYVLKARPNDTSTANDYTGDNSSAYGGDIGNDATYGAGFVICTSSVAGREWRVTVSGPILAITKTVDSITTTAPEIGNGAYPGALITYKIAVTNSGAGSATGVFIRDSVPANTTYVATSLRCSAGETSAALTFATCTSNSDANSDDAGAATSPNIEFCPNGTAASLAGGGEDGSINTEAGGNDVAACFFRVTIN
jgi:uncharacterized repeat protein (TIGR01451 family)